MTDFYMHFMQVACYKGLIDLHYNQSESQASPV